MGEAVYVPHALFQRVEKTLLEQVLAGANLVRAARGETVYDRHQFRRCLGVVLEGRIRVRKDTLVVSNLKEGDLFGAAALFYDGDEYPTTLTALADCRLLLLPQEGVRLLLRESPEFAEDYAAYLSGRIRFLSARLDTVSAGSAEEKLVNYLRTCPGETVTISATQLCQRIGVGRATLYRAFETLQTTGVIAREGKKIRLLNPEH